MKVICTQRELAKGVAVAGRAVAARSTLPILGNILLEAKYGQLRLSATNLRASINCWIRAEVVEEGAITVPARLFADIIGKVAGGKVEVELNERTQSIELRCGRYKAKMMGRDAEDFPVTLAEGDQGDCVELDRGVFAGMIEQVAFAAAKGEDRPVLHCVRLLMAGQRLTMAGTDSFRLSMRCAPLAATTGEIEMLIARPSMSEVANLLADADPDAPVQMRHDRQHGSARFAVVGREFVRAEIATQLTDARFPDYMAIIPKSKNTTVAVDTATLLRSLRVAKLFAIERPGVDLTATPAGCLTLAVTDAHMGNSVDAVEAEIQGQAVEISLDIDFLLDIISRIDSPQTVLEMTRGDRPIMVRPFSASPDEFIHVIMPMGKKKGA